ncbi:MAG: hypothetical protein V4710_01760, partial [Verrucomicrobiota bacterium]
FRGRQVLSRGVRPLNRETFDVMRIWASLTGVALAGQEEFHHFVDTHYGALDWFNALADRWLGVVNAWRLPDAVYPEPDKYHKPYIYYGIPFYFLLAATGLIVLALRPGPLRSFHLVWALTLLGFFFTIMLTANIRPRFRFVFEPFWFFYIAALAESLWIGVGSLFRQK